MAVGGVGKLSLRQLFLDHCGLDLSEGCLARGPRHVGRHFLLLPRSRAVANTIYRNLPAILRPGQTGTTPYVRFPEVGGWASRLSGAARAVWTG